MGVGVQLAGAVANGLSSAHGLWQEEPFSAYATVHQNLRAGGSCPGYCRRGLLERVGPLCQTTESVELESSEKTTSSKLEAVRLSGGMAQVNRGRIDVPAGIRR